MLFFFLCEPGLHVERKQIDVNVSSICISDIFGYVVNYVFKGTWAVVRFNSLPEFMNFKLFGKTILVVNIKL